MHRFLILSRSIASKKDTEVDGTGCIGFDGLTTTDVLVVGGSGLACLARDFLGLDAATGLTTRGSAVVSLVCFTVVLPRLGDFAGIT